MRRARLAVPVAVALLVLGAAGGAAAFDGAAVLGKGTVMVSVEGGLGAQANLEGFADRSDLDFVNAGLRVSFFPLEPVGRGPLRGALEVGLEPFYQRYTGPVSAFWSGLGAVGRYHFLALGPLVPYLEVFAGGGGTDLKVREIRSSFAFLLQGGAGASLFVASRVALYAGYRIQHVSNGNTTSPNRGFESHIGIAGVSYVFP